MTITVLISAAGAPGVSTTVAALATAWPQPVLVIDADPTIGALVPGWLSRWWASGHVSTERGVVSFAASTRRLQSVPAEGLAGHTQEVPLARWLRVLAGVTCRQHAAAIGTEGWTRLASAARDLTSPSGPDVLVDAGRWSSRTPWPLVEEADRVLVGVRPTLRHLPSGAELAAQLRERVEPARIQTAVLAARMQEAHDAANALELPLGLALPDDPASARTFSDGTPPLWRLERRPLWRAVRNAARTLHRLDHPTPAVDHDHADTAKAGTSS